MTEKATQKLIIDYLKAKRIFHFRANTGAVKADYFGKKRLIRFGTPGCADILCCFRGRFVGIEVKSEKGKQTKLQQMWQESLENAGGLYILAFCLEDVTNALKRLGPGTEGMSPEMNLNAF